MQNPLKHFESDLPHLVLTALTITAFTVAVLFIEAKTLFTIGSFLVYSARAILSGQVAL